MRRSTKIIAAAGASTLAAASGYMAARLKASLPRTSGTLSFACFSEGVEVVYDHAGIPHITAANDADGYRALGFVMAQDRMLQMQMMLRVASGTLAESVGKMALDMDRFMRTIGLARAGERFAEGLNEDSRAALGAFCEGVNTYLSRGSLRLPFEFMLLGGRPGPWRPADCLTLGLFNIWLLDSFWPADLMREKLIRALGRERAMELLPETAPYNNPPVKVDGPGPRAETLDPQPEVDWDFTSDGGGGAWLPTLKAPTVFGSNNWVLSGEKTTTGRPILCGDPHVQHNAPGVLYLCHLRTPSVDSIGATFPGAPIIAFGHNGYCGWSVTSLCPDTQDLYLETFESEESDRYLADGEWIEPEVIEEDVKVRFGRDRRLRVLVTRHGPVIQRKGDRGLAVRWVSHDTTLDSMSALIRMNRARSWDEFNAAMEDYVGPAMNLVYADVDGNIAYLAAAKIPRRSNGDGTIPCDGASGECEWDGYIPFSEMPRAVNPPDGMIVTANSKIVSDGYPELITKAWEAPYRNGRITEMLRAREKWAPDEMRQVHADVFTFPGRRFARLVAEAAAGRDLDGEVARAVGYLEAWDHQAKADSVAMSIYFYSWRHLERELVRHRLGSTLFQEYACSWTSTNLAVENLLENRDAFWLPPGCGSFEDLALSALEAGLEDLRCVFGGEDMGSWRWGRVHYLECQNLVGLFWPLNRIFNVGPVPRDGEGDTVNAATPSSDCLTQLLARGTMGGCTDMVILPDCDSHAAYAGPVMRMILDFSDLDRSRAVLDVGQSGHRLSPHYKDHFPTWMEVDYLPLPYSRKAVEEQAESTLRFTKMQKGS